MEVCVLWKEGMAAKSRGHVSVTVPSCGPCKMHTEINGYSHEGIVLLILNAAT